MGGLRTPSSMDHQYLQLRRRLQLRRHHHRPLLPRQRQLLRALPPLVSTITANPENAWTMRMSGSFHLLPHQGAVWHVHRSATPMMTAHWTAPKTPRPAAFLVTIIVCCFVVSAVASAQTEPH